MNTPDDPPRAEGERLEPRLRRLTRRGFALGGAAALTGAAGWRWLVTRSDEDGLAWPFRRVLGFNEGLARGVPVIKLGARIPPQRSTRASRQRPDRHRSHDRSGVLEAPRHGRIGRGRARLLRLEEIKALPRVEMTTELKCIEGWSVVVDWAGARLADLASSTGLASRDGAGDRLSYAALATPDAAYYVGLDMASALHPQTLLCYEMNGEPLTPEHGAPLRLAIPTKYGIKNLKQIGTIQFTDRRPADYWAERGYDWYSGH